MSLAGVRRSQHDGALGEGAMLAARQRAKRHHLCKPRKIPAFDREDAVMK